MAVGLAKLSEHADSAANTSRISNYDELFTKLIDHSLPHLPYFTPQALANFIWALATAGQQPCGAWLTEYYRNVERKVDVLKSQDIANIMWALCKFDLMPDIWLMDALVSRALPAISEQPAASGQDPATLIQCLARYYYLYNYRVSDEWLHEFLRIVRPNLSSYMPFDLVSIVHSCVVMSHQPSRLWMAEYYLVLKDRLMFDPTLSYSDFQRLMWALSRIDYTPTQTWQRDFIAVSTPKLRHLKFRALGELIWALACWDCRPSREWLSEFFRVTHGKLGDFRPQHISNTLNALAKLECRAPGPWLDAALTSFCKQLSDAKAHDMVTLLDTVTVVCEDKSWLMGHTDQIKALADTAASKFAVYDTVMHTKLCVALAAANICPAADWLKQQQQSLLACLRGGDVESQAAAQQLRKVYRTWDVQVEADLEPFL